MPARSSLESPHEIPFSPLPQNVSPVCGEAHAHPRGGERAGLLIDLAATNPPYAQRMREEVFARVLGTRVADPAQIAAISTAFARRTVTADMARLQAACAKIATPEPPEWSYEPAMHLAALLVLRRDQRTLGALQSLDPTVIATRNREHLSLVAWVEDVLLEKDIRNPRRRIRTIKRLNASHRVLGLPELPVPADD